MTPEAPEARRIRQASERTALVLETAAEFNAALAKGNHPIEALGAVMAAAGRDHEMTRRHPDEWAPDVEVKIIARYQHRPQSPIRVRKRPTP